MLHREEHRSRIRTVDIGQWGTSRIISYYEVKLKPTPSSSEAWFPIVRGEVQVQ